MAVTRYQPSSDPLRPFFDDFLMPMSRLGMRLPETDVVETESEIRVVCDLPGMKAEDINLDLENNVLTISGERQEEHEEGRAGESYHMTERRWGRFTRSFVLPRQVEQERIEANYAEGVLTVTIPKNESARRRRIEISDGGHGGRRIEAQKGDGGTNR
jgi:HSP20 family protein